jgi:hypothetical protein
MHEAVAFWMGVASAEHARGGRDGGFAQLGHGKHMAVKSLRKGSWIVYYSPRRHGGRRDGAGVHDNWAGDEMRLTGPSKRWTSIRNRVDVD